MNRKIFRVLIPGLVLVASAAGLAFAGPWRLADDSLSDDPRVRWDTERAKWDLRRKTWDTEPSEHRITLPDYHHVGASELRAQTNEADRRLRVMVQEALHWVTDDRLSTLERLEALYLVEFFNPELTAAALIEMIELRDERNVFYTGPIRGRLPIVTVLADYGVAVVGHVNFALAKERPKQQRDLLLSVLVKVLGVQRAKEQLTEYAAKKGLSETQKKRLQSAIVAIGRTDAL